MLFQGCEKTVATQIVWDYRKKKKLLQGNWQIFFFFLIFSFCLFGCSCAAVCAWVCMFRDRELIRIVRFLRVCVPGTCCFTSCPSSLNNRSQSERASRKQTKNKGKKKAENPELLMDEVSGEAGADDRPPDWLQLRQVALEWLGSIDVKRCTRM